MEDRSLNDKILSNAIHAFVFDYHKFVGVTIDIRDIRNFFNEMRYCIIAMTISSFVMALLYVCYQILALIYGSPLAHLRRRQGIDPESLAKFDTLNYTQLPVSADMYNPPYAPQSKDHRYFSV